MEPGADITGEGAGAQQGGCLPSPSLQPLLVGGSKDGGGSWAHQLGDAPSVPVHMWATAGAGEAQGCLQRKRGSHLCLAPCSLGHSPDPRLLQAGGAPVPRTPLRMAEPSSSWEGLGDSPTRKRHLLDPVCELRP